MAVLRPVNGFGIKDLNMETTRLEKTNLEAHVDLCAERYKQLESRLDTIETKIEEIAQTIQDNKNSLATTIISSAGTVVVGIIGLIMAILFKF